MFEVKRMQRETYSSFDLNSKHLQTLENLKSISIKWRVKRSYKKRIDRPNQPSSLSLLSYIDIDESQRPIRMPFDRGECNDHRERGERQNLFSSSSSAFSTLLKETENDKEEITIESLQVLSMRNLVWRRSFEKYRQMILMMDQLLSLLMRNLSSMDR